MEWLTAVEGLSDDNINSIIPGDDGKLWISTGNGISAYDPESRQFTNYMGRSEIPVNEFSMKGGIKLLVTESISAEATALSPFTLNG